MKDVLALADLQFRRFRSWTPLAPGSHPGVVLFNQAVLLLFSLWLFRGWTDPGRLYIEWVTIHLTVVTIITGSQWFTSGGTEWWLTIPRPRMHLAMGMAIGCLRMGLHLVLYMEATVLLHYATALILHWGPGMSWPQFVREAGTFTLLDLAALVPAVGIGVLQVVFARGWAMVGGFFSYFALVLSNVLLAEVAAGWPVFDRLRSDAPVIAMGAVVIGWPLSWFLLRLAAGVGLRRLGDVRLVECGARFRPQMPAERAGNEKNRAGRSPFWSLFALERARYRWWGAGAPPMYRWFFGAAMAGAAAAGFVMMGMPESIRPGSLVVGSGGYIYAMYRMAGFLDEPFRQGWGSWWLAIPRPRWVILAGRWLALWTSVVEIISLALISLGIGFTARGLVGGSAASLVDAWKIAGDMWLIVTLLFTVNFLLLQITPALFRHWALSWFLIPLYVIVYGGFGWILRWIVFDGQGPGFGYRLGLLAGIGIPLGLLCFWIGSRSLNRLIDMEDVWNTVGRLRSKI
ncbi:MAG: hypothetical protein KM312_13650 [Hydrogenibacillus schlegelii]|uniref:Uncharacterized protein n=1 Tax=Hydrogenibacillus schlegelii TaxID=1484 RepID=A0A947GAM7_HYDSH|nr:hypothetical protein [Hydrogenibacillus schlegelii]